MELDLLVKDLDELATFDSKLGFVVKSKVSVGIKDGKFEVIGPSRVVNKEFRAKITIDAKGLTMIPGFVDCHTHLVYAGCRHEEFQLRLRGISYSDILKKGGGINYTVKLTRETSERELLELVKERAYKFLRNGITTLEIKTGYGLDYENEFKILRVIRELKKEVPLDIFATFMPLHAIPPEFKDRRGEYVELAKSWLKEAREYADFVDVFMDEGAFEFHEAMEFLEEASKYGFKLKIHADELSQSNGAYLASQMKCISAEHLCYSNEEDFLKMKENYVVPVVLPITSFFLKSGKWADARKMLDLGLPVALATDHNPGTSPVFNSFLVLWLSVFKLNLTMEEAVTGFSYNSAKALGVESEIGSIEIGKKADFLLLRCHSFVHLFYELDDPSDLIVWVFKNGKPVIGET